MSDRQEFGVRKTSQKFDYTENRICPYVIVTLPETSRRGEEIMYTFRRMHEERGAWSCVRAQTNIHRAST